MSDEPATVVPLGPEAKPDFLKQRLLSLDAYRGLIMVTLAFSGFGLEATAKRHLAEEKAPAFWEAVRYHFLYLLWGRSSRTQAFAAVCILVGTWLMYTLYPYSGIDLSTGAEEVGVKKEWAQEYLAGIDPKTGERAPLGYPIAPPWHKN